MQIVGTTAVQLLGEARTILGLQLTISHPETTSNSKESSKNYNTNTNTKKNNNKRNKNNMLATHR